MTGAVSNKDGLIGSTECATPPRAQPKTGECGNPLFGHPDPGVKRASAPIVSQRSETWKPRWGLIEEDRENPVGQYPNRKEWTTPQREQERPRSECRHVERQREPITGRIGQYPGRKAADVDVVSPLKDVAMIANEGVS